MISESIIQAAKTEAEKSKYRYRLGAVALIDNKIVARAHNKCSKHPFLSRRYGCHSIHAEAGAILKGKHYGANVLVVVRILKDGRLTCSFPCKQCQAIARDFSYKKIIYVDWNGNIQELKI
jgi:deoxycytidylate deaminase